MKYVDENNKQIDIKDVWKYEYVSSDSTTVYFKTPSENYLRFLRDKYCFSIINRGSIWYRTLTPEQDNELAEWYQKWLNVTDTMVIPDKPSWLK